MRAILIEACVETLEESVAAERGGADRLELCANMAVSGTTPSDELIAAVKSAAKIPVSVMIRPRGGSFVHSATEIVAMHRAIDRAKELGADMLVIGVLEDSGRVNEPAMRALVRRAGTTPVTFHKAFDEIVDQREALETLIDAGVSRVLTSAGAPTAVEGRAALARLVEQAGDRLTIMAGGRVRGANVCELLRESSVREIHARCAHDETVIRELRAALVG
jgi:copper homeostasis protein